MVVPDISILPKHFVYCEEKTGYIGKYSITLSVKVSYLCDFSCFVALL